MRTSKNMRSMVVCCYATLIILSQQTESKICFIQYQLADNNLDLGVRKNLLDYIDSCAISRDDVVSWVYFDPFYSFPLESVYQKDGSSIPQDQDIYGSYYLTYDHSLSKMVVDFVSYQEVNSDDPQSVENFVTYALTDCVARGTDETFLVFNDHGAGVFGFGGDDNPFRRHRNLGMSNENITGALQNSLANVQGGPSKFTVLGFDACLMSSVETLSVYSEISDYFLASEAVESYFGWAYSTACDFNTALEMAKEIRSHYINEMQQPTCHETPKTLSLIESSKFEPFHSSFEDLAIELKRIFEEKDDPDFFALMVRSRDESVAFQTVLDDAYNTKFSGVDVGSILHFANMLCNPRSSSQLRVLLDNTLNTYEAMFVEHGVGPGTQNATGMHVTFPHKEIYLEYPDFFDEYLLNNLEATSTSPAWYDFVNATLTQYTTPTSATGIGKTCSNSATWGGEPEREGLFLNPHLYETEKGAIVRSELDVSTDHVNVLLGFDVTASFDQRRRRELFDSFLLSHMPPNSNSFSPESLVLSEETAFRRRRLGYEKMIQKDDTRTSLQGNDDYVIMYAGSSSGSYASSSFSARWDGLFFGMKDEDNLIPIFIEVRDPSCGAVSVPVIYFEGLNITSGMLTLESTIEDAIAIGGIEGSLYFGLDGTSGEVTTCLTLVVNGAAVWQPSGAIVPVLPVKHVMSDQTFVKYYVGGIGHMVVDWFEDGPGFDIVPVTSHFHNKIIVSMYAFDMDIYDPNSSTSDGLDVVHFLLDGSETHEPTSQSTSLEDYSCFDNPEGWYDQDGPTYNCEWYSRENHCDEYGYDLVNFGKTASQACCTCGGGTTYDNKRSTPMLPDTTKPPQGTDDDKNSDAANRAEAWVIIVSIIAGIILGVLFVIGLNFLRKHRTGQSPEKPLSSVYPDTSNDNNKQSKSLSERYETKLDEIEAATTPAPNANAFDQVASHSTSSDNNVPPPPPPSIRQASVGINQLNV